MNTTKFVPADWISVLSVIFSVAGAALGLCQMFIPGIILAAVGGVAGVAVKFLGKKWGVNERISNVAFIIGIFSVVMAAFGAVTAAVIDKIFANAQV